MFDIIDVVLWKGNVNSLLSCLGLNFGFLLFVVIFIYLLFSVFVN